MSRKFNYQRMFKIHNLITAVPGIKAKQIEHKLKLPSSKVYQLLPSMTVVYPSLYEDNQGGLYLCQ